MANPTPNPPQPAPPPVQPPPVQPPPPPAPDPVEDPWLKTERVLIGAAPAVLALTLALPVILLATTSLHNIAGADKKMLALCMSVLFAGIAIVFLARFVRSLESGEPLGIESHWGGLGGGVGGWRISRPIVYLLPAIVFAALTAVAMSSYLPSEKKEEKKPPATDTTKTTASVTTKQGTTTTAGTTQGTTTTQAPASDTTATAQTATKGQ